MHIYFDDVYEKDGKYYTGEYLRNQRFDKKEYKLIDKYNVFDKTNDKEVRCNYLQLFFSYTDMILCNEIPDQLNIYDYMDFDRTDEDGEPLEIYQWYFVDHHTAAWLKEHTDEIIIYYEPLDINILCVTHYGTAWDCVPASFKC